jgi:hypothetical protein
MSTQTMYAAVIETAKNRLSPLRGVGKYFDIGAGRGGLIRELRGSCRKISIAAAQWANS